MNPPIPTPEVAPLCRVPAFAESVRARLGLGVSAAHPLRLNATRRLPRSSTHGPSPVERAFRTMPPAPTPTGRPGSRPPGGAVRLDAHLHLRLAIEHRLSPGAVRRLDSPGRKIPERAAATWASRPSLTLVSRDAHPHLEPHAPTDGRRGVAASVPPPVGSTPAHGPTRLAPPVRSTPTPVPQVHRATALPAPEPVAPPGSPAASPLRVTAHWDGSTATAPGRSSAALTAADLPGVVDHVVQEIDRRVAAARERRGWTS